jgi:hypothetical protein
MDGRDIRSLHHPKISSIETAQLRQPSDFTTVRVLDWKVSNFTKGRWGNCRQLLMEEVGLLYSRGM